MVCLDDNKLYHSCHKYLHMVASYLLYQEECDINSNIFMPFCNFVCRNASQLSHAFEYNIADRTTMMNVCRFLSHLWRGDELRLNFLLPFHKV